MLCVTWFHIRIKRPIASCASSLVFHSGAAPPHTMGIHSVAFARTGEHASAAKKPSTPSTGRPRSSSCWRISSSRSNSASESGMCWRGLFMAGSIASLDAKRCRQHVKDKLAETVCGGRLSVPHLEYRASFAADIKSRNECLVSSRYCVQGNVVSMRITKLSIRNFRTLESVDLVFPSLYSAICGQNDSGKTNIVRAIRAFVREESPFDTLFSHGPGEFSLQNDFPKFNETKEKERFIQFTVDFVIKQQQDAGFYEFLKKQLTLNHDAESLAFQIETKYFGIAQEPTVKVTVLETVYDGLAAQEVLQKLQSSRSVLVHNSIRIESGFPFGPPIGQLGATSQDEEALVASMKRTVNKGLAKLSKTHKQELETLLGRLGTKYDVGLSVPAFDFASVPFNITLGHKKYDVPLDDCGSGTRNRTLILLTLFRAKRVS